MGREKAPATARVELFGANAAPGAVLLVEDDELLAGSLRRLLRAAGFDVTITRDGAAAARLLEDRAFDVVLSDLHLTGVDGIQLLRRARERDVDVPVVLITGAPSIESAARA